eukprot:scaffold140857_cov31-Tisochrysis_lutea.AAC.3
MAIEARFPHTCHALSGRGRVGLAELQRQREERHRRHLGTWRNVGGSRHRKIYGGEGGNACA